MYFPCIMDFSQPYDEKDPKRFTLADYDGESNDDSRPPLPRNPSSSSMTSANAQRKPSLRRKPAPQAGGLALHNPVSLSISVLRAES